MKDYSIFIITILVVVIISILLILTIGNSSKSSRSSKPRCKCGTANCNDSNCDPGVERMVQVDEVATTRTIPLEIPPSRR